MLPERDFSILRGIVDLYVRAGVPVGSARLQEHLGLPISSATIRNTMAVLERDGYLVKPHTSGGRIPTEMGYRTYVDQLEQNHAFVNTFADAFRAQFREQQADIGAIMASASRVLGALSKNFAVVYGSVDRESRVTRIQLIPLEGSRLLVAVHLTPDVERTTTLRFDRVFTEAVVRRAEELINREVENRTLDEARGTLRSLVRDNITDEGIIAREVACHRREIFSEPPSLEFYFEEREHLGGQPGFTDPRLLQLLLRFLQDRKYLATLLASRLGDTQVTIGHEHDAEELQPFSLVTSGYRLGVARGVLGIIGPTRMRYDLIHALVGSASRGLEAIGDEYL